MLKSTLVSIPKGSKIYKQNDNYYVYHVIDSIYHKDKKYNTEKRTCIGRKFNDDKMYPNDNYFKYYSSPEEYIEASPEFSDCIKIGAMAVFDFVLNELGISNMLDFITKDNSNLFKDLIYYYTFGNNTVTQYYKYFIREHFCYSNKIYSDSQISKILNQLTDDNISNFLTDWNNKQQKENILVDFDGTNINSSNSNSDLTEFGHPKIDEGLPQINLSYAIDHNSGLPLFYELYPGSITDMSETKIMIDKAKNYGFNDKNITFILDRGMFSKNNLDYLEGKNIKYIIMAKLSLEVINNTIIGNINKIKNQYSCYIPNHNLYGKTFERDIFKDKKVKYLHIYYDDEKASIERKVLSQNLAFYEESLNIVLKEKKKISDLKPYKKYFSFKTDKDGFIKSYNPNNEIIQKELEFCGFFAIVTADKLDVKYVIDEYRKRDIVEKTFRDVKSYIGLNKFRVHSDISIKTKTFLTFITAIIKANLKNKLASYLHDSSSETLVTTFKEIEKIQVTKINNVYVKRYALTSKQRKILDALNIKEDIIDGYIKILNSSQ